MPGPRLDADQHRVLARLRLLKRPVEGWLVEVSLPTTVIVSEQGLEAGRPSTLLIEVDGSDEILGVRVGGQVVKVMEGTLTF